MDERDLFDELYTLWSKTTGAEDRYWMPVEYTDPSGRFRVYAVDPDGDRKLIASEMRDEDADFITGIHGVLPDLIRRVNDALDEADRADQERDSRECRIAELEMECRDYRQIIQNLSQAKDAPWHQRTG